MRKLRPFLFLCVSVLILVSCDAGGTGENTASEVPGVEETTSAAVQVTETYGGENATAPSVSAPTNETTSAPGDELIIVSPSISTGTPVCLATTSDMGEDYLSRITFLGDSLTYGLKVYGMLADGKATKQVWVPANGTFTLANQSFVTVVYPPTGEEISVREAAERAQPDILLINLGVNGVSFMEEEYFKEEYVALIQDIQRLSPRTKIILQSIFPIAENYKSQKSINNEKIAEANKWIFEIAGENGIRYLDSNSAFVGEDGWLPRKYESGDGMHFTPAAYRVELENIRTHAITN